MAYANLIGYWRRDEANLYFALPRWSELFTRRIFGKLCHQIEIKKFPLLEISVSYRPLVDLPFRRVVFNS
jgi:hypothetical protein